MTDEALPKVLRAGAHKVYVNPASTYMVLDFETTNLDKGSALNPDNRIVLACWYMVLPDGTIENKFVYGDEYEMDELLADIERVDFVVAHNTKFELRWLKRCGLDLRNVLFFDTMLGAWVLDGNRSLPRGLDDLASRLGVTGKMKLVANMLKRGVCPSTIRKDWLTEYCFADIRITLDIFRIIVRALEVRGQLHLAHTRNLTHAVLADIEGEGLHLDKKAVEEEYQKTLAIWEERKEKLYATTGGINLDSPKQLAVYLYDTLKFAIPKDHFGKPLITGKGQPSTSEPTLALLEAKTDEQRDFLVAYKQFNEANTLLTKNLTFMQKVCEEYDGTFYGIFNLNIVGTHRLSSSGVPLLFKGEKKTKGIQLQNIPRAFKRLFWSGDEDYEIVEADGAQLEFRIAVELGKDAVGMKEISEDVDVHTITADYLLEHGYPTFDVISAKERRQDSKQYTFKPLFGGRSGHEAVVKYCEFFKEKYQGISETQHGWAVEAFNTKQQHTPYGMRFYWPNTTMYKSGQISGTTQIYNYPIQSFSTGEIIPLALVHFWHRSKHLRVRIFTTIHDSIAAYVHKEDIEACRELMRVSLTDDIYRYLRENYDYNFTTPLGVGVKSARNWGTSKSEYIWNVFPDGSHTFKQKD